MIRVLTPQIVNQIAAGEVIERPFSVVKELVENSLDAGARRVSVELVEGGTRGIRITDDGAGFAMSDLGLAFVSHATSKLSELADLDHIASLGFRGEALASIGAISRASIRSRTPGEDGGYEVRCDGGESTEVRPCGCPPGSIVEIRDLFYNTPARRRFLKSPRAERARGQDHLVRLALAHLEVDFTFTVDDKQVLRLPAGESLRDRVERTFGGGLARGLHELDHRVGAYAVTGVVGDPDVARRDSTQEILFINGRVARDRGVMFAVRQAYREFLMHRQYPVYFLHLSLPPDEVDVNVHPTKAEVRFVHPRKATGILHEAVKGALSSRGFRAVGLSVGEEMPQALSGMPDLPRDLFARPVVAEPGVQRPVESVASTARAERRENPFAPLVGRRFVQALDLYLVFEGPDGIVVVDQHALHERVLYEQFRARHEGRDLQVQRLLVPEVLDLEAADKEWLLASRSDLAAEGLLLEDFGGPSIAVAGVPAVLGGIAPRVLIETFLVGDGTARPSVKDAVVERFHSMACRAAVMSGDRLGEEEIASLLEAAQELEHPHNCPHGRPTVLSFTGVELEKYFRRRV